MPKTAAELNMGAQDALDRLRINTILAPHKDKNFVQRIMAPDKYPSLPLPEEGPDVSGTHKMSYSTNDQGAVVYPMIIQDEQGKTATSSTW